MNSLFIIDRGFGLIRFASIGWPAATNDMYILSNCSLFNTIEKRNTWAGKYGNLVADQGFFNQLFDFILCPIASRFGGDAAYRRWNQLSPEQKEWSKRISKIEVKIENTFSQIFVQKYKLIKKKPKPICYNADFKHPQLILAASLLYNLEIIWNKRSILDGPDL